MSSKIDLLKNKIKLILESGKKTSENLKTLKKWIQKSIVLNDKENLLDLKELVKIKLEKLDYSVVLFSIMFLKILTIYIMYGFYSWTTLLTSSMFSACFIVLCISLFMRLTVRKKTYLNIFLVIYIINSLLMMFTAVYIGYFGEYPSLQLLNQLSQVSAITGSAFEFIKLYHFWFVIDLPILMYMTYKNIGLGVWNSRFSSKKVACSAVFMMMANLLVMNSSGIVPSDSEYFLHWLNESIAYGSGEELSGNIPEDVLKHEANKTISKLKKGKSMYIQNEEGKKYFGVAKDMNLVVIQMESFQDFPINMVYEGREVTPYLNKLIKEKSFYFPNYFHQVGRGNTSDAEFVTNNSLYPAMHGKSYNLYEKSEFYGLPWILRDKGYTTAASHGYKAEFWNRKDAYPAQGFQRAYFESSFDVTEKIGFGMSDETFFMQTIENMKKMEEPYYNMTITLSNHHPYKILPQFDKLGILGEDDDFAKRYLTSVNYTDYAIGQFIEKLKEEKMYENTVFALYGDHHGIITREESANEISKLLGRKYNYEDMMNVPLIIHIPTIEKSEIIDSYSGQMDFLPTILNLFGIEPEGKLMYGSDIINNPDNLVEFQTHMLRGSFITDKLIFNMSKDGSFENSKAWIPYEENKEIELTDEIEKIYESVIKEIQVNDYILDKNMIGTLTGRKMDEIKILGEKVVAKAGGVASGVKESNSFEAFHKSYLGGCRYFNIQVMLTEDGFPVLIKDWEKESLIKLSKQSANVLKKEEFDKSFMINGMTKLSVLSYCEWEKTTKGVTTIITSEEENMGNLLSVMVDELPEVTEYMVVVNNEEEFKTAESLGFKRIIIDFDKMKNTYDYSDATAIREIEKLSPYGLIVGEAEVEFDIINRLEDKKVKIYVDDVDEEELYNKVIEKGYTGIFTNELFIR
jgi:phosphoglycerol transferase MdoB-like AlkP superfamily enzyme